MDFLFFAYFFSSSSTTCRWGKVDTNSWQENVVEGQMTKKPKHSMNNYSITVNEVYVNITDLCRQ